MGLLANGALETKKQSTFERGMESKVPVVYAMESKAERADAILENSSFKRMRHMPHKNLPSTKNCSNAC